jgi:hypothetical protein
MHCMAYSNVSPQHSYHEHARVPDVCAHVFYGVVLYLIYDRLLQDSHEQFLLVDTCTKTRS